MSKRRTSVRIFLVDDTEAVRNILARTLRAAGHDVITLNEVQAARRLYIPHHFDLVISDNDCPGSGEGREWLLDLQDRGQKVLLISGKPVDDLRGLPFLEKPINGSELVATVARLVGSPKK
jgi:DNA-binding NtrC family response regulator